MITDITNRTNGVDDNGAATNSGFARVVFHETAPSPGAGEVSSAEYDYWNVRTTHNDTDGQNGADQETASVSFNAGDKVYVKYALNGGFQKGDALTSASDDPLLLTALASNADVLNPSPFASVTVDLSFILGWTIA